MFSFEAFSVRSDENVLLCKLCGRVIGSNYPDSTATDMICSHLYGHHVRCDNSSYPVVRHIGLKLSLISKVRGHTYSHTIDKIARLLFPHMLLLTVGDVDSFSIALRQIVNTTVFGTTDDVMFESGGRNEELMELFSKELCICAFCGSCYDSGIPSPEIAFDHVMKCELS